MEVFDALANIIPGDSEPKETQPQQDAPESKAPNPEFSFDANQDIKLNSSNESRKNDFAASLELNDEHEDDLVFEDSEEERKRAEQDIFDDEQLSDSLLDLDKDGSVNAFTDDAVHLDDHSTTTSSDDEDWAKNMLDEDETSSAERNEPSYSPIDEVTPVDSIAPEPSDYGTNEESPQTIDFYYEDPSMKASRGTLAKVLIGTGCLVLVLILAAQAAWFNYERLAQYPAAKQGFAFACKHIGCKLPELVDLKAIRSSNLIVRSHPLVANTLIIDVVLTNEAAFAQDYPRLALYFSDINGKTVAQQIIPPKHYLNDATLLAKQMPSDEPIHVSIEIEDPGKQAVNYTIRFFPHNDE